MYSLGGNFKLQCALKQNRLMKWLGGENAWLTHLSNMAYSSLWKHSAQEYKNLFETVTKSVSKSSSKSVGEEIEPFVLIFCYQKVLCKFFLKKSEVNAT